MTWVLGVVVCFLRMISRKINDDAAESNHYLVCSIVAVMASSPDELRYEILLVVDGRRGTPHNLSYPISIE